MGSIWTRQIWRWNRVYSFCDEGSWMRQFAYSLWPTVRALCCTYCIGNVASKKLTAPLNRWVRPLAARLPTTITCHGTATATFD